MIVVLEMTVVLAMGVVVLDDVAKALVVCALVFAVGVVVLSTGDVMLAGIVVLEEVVKLVVGVVMLKEMVMFPFVVLWLGAGVFLENVTMLVPGAVWLEEYFFEVLTVSTDGIKMLAACVLVDEGSVLPLMVPLLEGVEVVAGGNVISAPDGVNLADGVVMFNVIPAMVELFSAVAVVLVLVLGRLELLPLGKMVLGRIMGLAVGSGLQAVRMVVLEKIVMLVGTIVQGDAVLLGRESLVFCGTEV